MATESSSRASDPSSILVVLPTWVGDFVMATPLLRVLRDRFQQASITFLLEPNLRDLVRGGDWMNECIEWPARDRRQLWHAPYRTLIRDLRGRRFDWAVLLPNSFRAALVAYLGGARRRFGYSRDGRGLLLTDGLAPANRRGGKYVPTPLVAYYADLAVSLGCSPPGDRFELATTADDDAGVDERLATLSVHDQHPLVVLSPGARYGAAKCWFPDRFAAVADLLAAEHGATIIITCGPGEEPIARAIGAAMNEKAHVWDDPRTSLGELKSLIARSDLLICNDAGPRHFAKAFDVPVVTVFGPTHPAWTATTHTTERIARIDVACGPCQKRTCPLGHLDCMTGVTVEAVYAAAVELLREFRPAVLS